MSLRTFCASLALAALSGCGVAATCTGDSVSCNGVCVDTRLDNLHCGNCGIICGIGTACANGACMSSCPAGQVACDGACIAPQTSATHCGARGDCTGAQAGITCGSGLTCQGGACACPSAGQVACGGGCVDPLTDDTHCGAVGDCSGAQAGAPCGSGLTCRGGACACPAAGEIACDGACTDPLTSRTHCGASGDCSGSRTGASCGSGLTCQGGACVQVAAPTITTQPAAQTVAPGQAATFTVAATGSAPIHYQWRKGSVGVGTDSATFVIASVTASDAGSYTVTVTNAAGSQVSAAAVLTVTTAPLDVAWSDEFDGPGIDTTKWAFDLGNGPTNPGPLYGWGNGEWQYYTSSGDNAAIEDGILVITARNQNWGGKPFTSARLVTRGKYSFNRGRFVARIKMPLGDRMWPAFWIIGDVVDDWPMSGEIDIAEMFAGPVGRGDNAMFATAHWWDEKTGQHVMNGATHTSPAPLANDFHVYELAWDSQSLRGSIDGTQFWAMDITDPTMSELRNNRFYIVLNLAVGSPNFGMTSADQVDGPMPQKMYVDYVRVYANGSSTVQDEVAAQPHGKLGILADGTQTDSQVDLVTGANLYLWNNLAAVTGAPAAGATSIAVQTQTTNWFGFGYAATKRPNLLNYAAGYLNFSVKTTSADAFKVGINGGNDGDAWVSFTNGFDPSGFVRDGQWHKISIPMTRFLGADFTDIPQFFMVASDDRNGLHVTPGQTYEFDEVYWSENAPENIVRPVGTRFGVFTERECDAGSFNATTDGQVFIWNKANGALTSGAPFEGASAFTFSAPGAQWYGLGYAPAKLYDLGAFARGHLHIALKIPASTTTDLKIGIKSPGGPAVRESWIKFKRGADPYGMVRDGQYHELLIPASDFSNSDFSAISQLLMLAGDGPASVGYDDVYWTVD